MKGSAGLCQHLLIFNKKLTIVNLLSFSLLYDIEPKKLLPKLKDFKK
jgi:hypothetical protein